MDKRKNLIKIVYHDGMISYYYRNDNIWIEVTDATSKLSRKCFRHTTLIEKSEEILKVILDEFSNGLGVDIIYTGDDDNYLYLLSTIKNKFPNANFSCVSCVRHGKISAAFSGLCGSGKTTLINAICKYLGEKWEMSENELFTTYKAANGQMLFYELKGVALDDDPLKIDKIVTVLETQGLDVLIYCIGIHKLHSIELEILDKIRCSHAKLKIIAVRTQSVYADEEAMGEEISRLLNGIKVIPVLAADYKTRVGNIEAYGIDNVVNYFFGGKSNG